MKGARPMAARLKKTQVQRELRSAHGRAVKNYTTKWINNYDFNLYIIYCVYLHVQWCI